MFYFNSCRKRLVREFWGYSIEVVIRITDTINDPNDLLLALNNQKLSLLPHLGKVPEF